MIFIDPKSHIITQLLEKRMEEVRSKQKLQWLDSKFNDFDGTLYKLTSDQEKKSIVRLSVKMPYFDDLKKHKCSDHLKTVYGDLLTDTENGFDCTVELNLDEEKEDFDETIKKCALIKRNAFAAPVGMLIDQSLAGGECKKPIEINITGKDCLYLWNKKDRLAACYAIDCDSSDTVLMELFLSEIVDTRKKPTLNAAPSVAFAKKPPAELKGVKVGHSGPYFTITLSHRHFKTPETKSKAIDLLCNMVPYISYHLKCAKAHIHYRMRRKTDEFIKVMNRAKFPSGKPKAKPKAGGKKPAKKKSGKKSPPKPPKKKKISKK